MDIGVSYYFLFLSFSGAYYSEAVQKRPFFAKHIETCLRDFFDDIRYRLCTNLSDKISGDGKGNAHNRIRQTFNERTWPHFISNNEHTGGL